ncbi:MAG: protein-L-isoaspartate O-methyltransferase [Thermoplasmata archaeon]|nr:protein-L-isoaspartate O-methyltransferase [Thermoplasmata archaeon]
MNAGRNEMVRRLGPLPDRVAEALRTVPRERFVRAEDLDRAYLDEPLPLASDGATISAPHMVAAQLDWLDLRGAEKVLEVGSGSGYLVALLAEMVGPSGVIHGVERDPALVASSRALLHELGYDGRCLIHVGDGARGWPDAAPFDRIVVSCATPLLRREWWEQLAPEGSILAPVGGSFSQTLLRGRRTEGREIHDSGPSVRFVPLVTGVPSDI